MRLYESMLEPFAFMDKLHMPDGEGGTIITYVPAATFNAVAVPDSTLAAVVAGVERAKVVYAVYMPSGVSTAFNDIIKRVSDGALFRITDAGQEPPPSATVKLRKAQAERWEL